MWGEGRARLTPAEGKEASGHHESGQTPAREPRELVKFPALQVFELSSPKQHKSDGPAPKWTFGPQKGPENSRGLPNLQHWIDSTSSVYSSVYSYNQLIHASINP